MCPTSWSGVRTDEPQNATSPPKRARSDMDTPDKPALVLDAPTLHSDPAIPRRDTNARQVGQPSRRQAGTPTAASRPATTIRDQAVGHIEHVMSDVSRVERDPERGRAAAAELRRLGVKGILIKAAEQGYITQVACKMPECFCPEELGGACHFDPVTPELSDWSPTHEHFPISKKEGGHRLVDNSILAHRLCNRIDYSIRVGRSYASDLERIRKAREEAIRRNSERP